MTEGTVKLSVREEGEPAYPPREAQSTAQREVTVMLRGGGWRGRESPGDGADSETLRVESFWRGESGQINDCC